MYAWITVVPKAADRVLSGLFNYLCDRVQFKIWGFALCFFQPIYKTVHVPYLTYMWHCQWLTISQVIPACLCSVLMIQHSIAFSCLFPLINCRRLGFWPGRTVVVSLPYNVFFISCPPQAEETLVWRQQLPLCHCPQLLTFGTLLSVMDTRPGTMISRCRIFPVLNYPLSVLNLFLSFSALPFMLMSFFNFLSLREPVTIKILIMCHSFVISLPANTESHYT